ncbi:MAG: hypothetical protein RR379_12290, partial [Clostridia bacterium]
PKISIKHLQGAYKKINNNRKSSMTVQAAFFIASAPAGAGVAWVHGAVPYVSAFSILACR